MEREGPRGKGEVRALGQSKCGNVKGPFSETAKLIPEK